MCNWIRCEDRLPEEGTRVLVWLPHSITKADIFTFWGKNDPILPWYDDNNAWRRMEETSHWSPIEPPKEADIDQTKE